MTIGVVSLFGAVRTASAELLDPIAAPQGLDEKKVALGSRLFSDRRLSKDNSISCASCHDLAHGGVDGKVTSTGVGGVVGDVNAPTVYNSALNFRQFWDGRAADLVEQAGGPIVNPGEMAADWPGVIERLTSEPTYVSAFARSYKDGITSNNIRDAIATFEKTLVLVDSKFDRYLKGDKTALNARERAGLDAFETYGCDSCHSGPALGGNSFERFGVVGKPAFRAGGTAKKADLGRFNVTRENKDLYRFKVPSLRNVVDTAPYFHNGSAATLEEAVKIMAEVQVRKTLDKEELANLTAFLGAVKGKVPEKPGRHARN